MRRTVTHCPACRDALHVEALRCPSCAVRVEGDFTPSPLARLSDEHQRFVVAFLRSRGVLRDLEEALGLSYPTVRARLDAAVAALEDILRTPGTDDAARREVLDAVASGALDPESAVRRLRARG